jgi:hypothetical protein
MTKTTTIQEEYLLFAIGTCFNSFNAKFYDKPLHVSFSKPLIIDVLISSKSVNKKQRALYKNFESLEKEMYLKYDKKELRFTRKGYDLFIKKNEEINKVNKLIETINNPKTIKLHKRLQTKLDSF